MTRPRCSISRLMAVIPIFAMSCGTLRLFSISGSLEGLQLLALGFEGGLFDARCT
jgi:hypothetical protein